MAELIQIPNKTEYSVSGFGSTKTNIHIGGRDVSVGSKVVPNVNKSWEFESGEEKFWLNLNRKDVVVDKEVATLKDGWLSLKIGDQTEEWFVSGNIFYWNIHMDKKPVSNVIVWELSFPDGVSFHYQHTLEYQFENFGGEGAKTLEEFLAMTHAPEGVEGSYAVYCDKNCNISRADGSVVGNYQTGKLCHIYRPYATDSAQNSVWCDLFIDPDSNLMQITIPQDFLDNAVYPITLDPDVGHTSCGAIAIQLNAKQRAVQATESESAEGVGVSMSFCADADYSSEETAMYLYESAASASPIANGDGGVLDGGDGTEKFYEFAFGGTKPTIVADTSYLPTVWGYDGDAMRMMYDSVSATRGFEDDTWTGTGNPGWPDPIAFTYGVAGFQYSTFLSYTVAAGGLSMAVYQQHMRKRLR